MTNPMMFRPEHPSLEEPTLTGAELLSLLQRTPIATLEKVLKVCEALERVDITVDGHLYIKLKHGLILEAKGNSIFYSKDYPLAIQVPLLHLNPDFKDVDTKKRLELEDMVKELDKPSK